MKIEKIAAIAEIVSSIAVVLTLIYLSVQTQQMSDQTRQMAIQSEQTSNAIIATSRQELMAADITMISALINNPEAWSNIDRPWSELTKIEQDQIINTYAATFRTREYAWFQYRNGILDEAAMNSYLAPMPRWIRRENGSRLWQQHSAELDPEFVNYVNTLIEQDKR